MLNRGGIFSFCLLQEKDPYQSVPHARPSWLEGQGSKGVLRCHPVCDLEFLIGLDVQLLGIQI